MIEQLIGPSLGAAIIAGLFSLLGFAVSNFFAERTRKDEHAHQERLKAQENAEWYKRQLFEKKLTVAQEAMVWVRKFNRALSSAELGQPNSEPNQTLLSLAREARKWYDNNDLHLYDELPTSSSFIGLTNAAEGYAASPRHDDTLQKSAWDNYIEVDKYVRERAKFLYTPVGQVS